MAITTSINYAQISDLYLDPTNPRLGRNRASATLSQEDVIQTMLDWTLDELALSFLESGYWPQEALIVVKEKIYGKERLVVVEGNRRLAALKALCFAFDGKPLSKAWVEIVKDKKAPKDLFDKVPYLEAAERKDVAAFLGFRHVTGIKEWKPAEKAQFIAKLIEDSKLSYEDVRRKIGSKTPTVRQHYIAYRLLLQMEDTEEISIEDVERKFSVLYLSLRTQGVQGYLHIDPKALPDQAKIPVPKEFTPRLVTFSKWLFGSGKQPPLFSDSRFVDKFGKVLESESAVDYLERTPEPRFELACRKAGVGEQEVLNWIENASDYIQMALSEAHVHKASERIHKAVKRLGKDVRALLDIFPLVKSEIETEK